jgi:calcineurin-like phosphoesterase family protein
MTPTARRLLLLVAVLIGLAALVIALVVVAGPGGGPIPSRGPVATPPLVARDAAVLVGAGDIATCGGSADEATAALLAGIPGTIFAAGDLAYPNGTKRDFADCYDPSWGRLKDRTQPALGNHELDGGRAATGYFAYFGDAVGTPGEGWYSFDVGAWHVVVLDSNCTVVACTAGSPQLAWLDADLAAHPSTCLAAIWHHPRFSSGEHGDDRRLIPIWDALQRAHAELALVGHDHDYERFAPLLADGTPSADGIREFVVGTGGAPFRKIGTLDAGSEVHQSDSHGVLRLALRPTGYDWAFIPIPGDTFTDTGSGTCH